MLDIEPIKTGSDGNLYIINCNRVYYLLECGIDKRTLLKTLYLKGLLISKFRGCFISHKHSDHIEGAKIVNEFMPIYSNRQVMEEKKYEGKILSPLNNYTFEGDLSVMPFNVEHGNAENYGYMFKNGNDKILFVTDFYKFDVNLKNVKFNQIFIECNWTKNLMDEAIKEEEDYKTKLDRQYNTHCSLDILKTILKESINLSECKKITLIHPSKDICDKELALKELKSLYPNICIEFAKNLI